METLLSLREVSELLKLQHYRIAYAIATHRIPEPAIRVRNIRVFQQADIERIARHFGVAIPSTEPVCATADTPSSS